MSHAVNLNSLELVAHLCSRICHDVISPVGAIVNGLEVLDEEGNGDMQEMAMDLIRKSAQQASAQLQFARLAFGASGAAGAEIDLDDAKSVAVGYMAAEMPKLVWELPGRMMAKDKVKLLLNIIALASNCVFNGGSVTVSMLGDAEQPSFAVKSVGKDARIPANVAEILEEGIVGPVDAQSIQPAYAWLLAHECGMRIAVKKVDDSVTFSVIQGIIDK